MDFLKSAHLCNNVMSDLLQEIRWLRSTARGGGGRMVLRWDDRRSTITKIS